MLAHYQVNSNLSCPVLPSPTAWQIFQEFSHYTFGKSCRAARSSHCLWSKEGALTNGY